MKQAVILALSAKAAAANERSSLKLRGAKTSQSEAERELVGIAGLVMLQQSSTCSFCMFYIQTLISLVRDSSL